MGIFRLLAIIFVIWLIVHFARRLLNARNKQPDRDKPGKIGRMVRCETCGLHIPEQEAIQKQGHFYCCKAHQDSDQN